MTAQPHNAKKNQGTQNTKRFLGTNNEKNRDASEDHRFKARGMVRDINERAPSSLHCFEKEPKESLGADYRDGMHAGPKEWNQVPPLPTKLLLPGLMDDHVDWYKEAIGKEVL